MRFFIEYKQRDWSEWLAIVEFVVNNKVHLATKVLPFMANYGRELRIRTDIRRKGKVEKAIEFVKRMRKVQEEAGAALRKAQKKIKQQVDKERREVEIWKKGNRVMLSTKDLVFRERLTKSVVGTLSSSLVFNPNMELLQQCKMVLLFNSRQRDQTVSY